MANYVQRREAWIRAGLEAGEQVGSQRLMDLMALALNDKDVMGKGVLGAERLKKVYKRIIRLESELAQAWQKGDEQDYYQAKLDRELERIFGDDFTPFEVRYPDVTRPK